MKYRKKPIPVEAFRFGFDPEPGWFREAIQKGTVVISKAQPFCHILTLEGTMIAQKGTWIIQGVNGELYPCQEAIFRKTYEPVGDCTGIMTEQTFTDIAKSIVAVKANEGRELNNDSDIIRPMDVYTVWQVKVLQNLKGLFAEPLPDGKYWEITYDGDREQFYVDEYHKHSNEAMPLDQFQI